MTPPAARLRALLDEVAFLKRRRGDDAIRQRACEAEISEIRYKHGDLEMRRPDDRFLCERFARALERGEVERETGPVDVRVDVVMGGGDG